MVIGHVNLDALAKKLSLFLPRTEYLVQPVPQVTHWCIYRFLSTWESNVKKD